MSLPAPAAEPRVSASPGAGSPAAGGGPSLAQRVATFLRHGHRILFRRWPDYSFDDLAAIQDTLDGPAFRRAADRMAADPEGAQLLAERPRLTVAGIDWDRMRALPTDTLGYCLWHHYHANGILEDVTLAAPRWPWDDETEYAKQRYRDTHDIRHVLVGVGISGPDEVVLQTFQWGQLRQILSVAIVVFGGLKFALFDGAARRLLRDLPRAWRAAKRARFLSLVRFEDHWARPLDELRAELGIEPVGTAYPPAARHPDAAPPIASQQAA